MIDRPPSDIPRLQTPHTDRTIRAVFGTCIPWKAMKTVYISASYSSLPLSLPLATSPHTAKHPYENPETLSWGVAYGLMSGCLESKFSFWKNLWLHELAYRTVGKVSWWNIIASALWIEWPLPQSVWYPCEPKCPEKSHTHVKYCKGRWTDEQLECCRPRPSYPGYCLQSSW